MSEKTFAHQNGLPRLPVPELESTCAGFLRSVAPLLDGPQFQEAEESVRAFLRLDGAGRRLQERLIEWAAEKERPNWLEPFWDDMYMSLRTPLPIHVNYFFALREIPTLQGKSQGEAAAAAVHAMLRFKTLLEEERVPVERERGAPLCMMQLRRLFTATRIPGRGRDHPRPAPNTESSPQAASSPPADHVVVMHGGRAYRLRVAAPGGGPVPLAAIAAGFGAILAERAPPLPAEESFGVLTASGREEWALARERLRALSIRNGAVLEAIEGALFAVCLDDASPRAMDDLAATMLHGSGRNRWFDKSIQLIVCANGRVGFNIEHSGLDGSVVLNLTDYVYRESGKNQENGEARGNNVNPEFLALDADDHIRAAIRGAGDAFDALRNDTAVRALIFDRFGKSRLKSLGVSPDGFVQLGFQTAQFRLFGRLGSTYETAMTRRFLHGRTETLRSGTVEARHFAEVFLSKAPPREKRDKMKGALNEHAIRMAACKNGNGVERHLFGLMNIQQRFGAELGVAETPDLFTGSAWRRLRHDVLSTSNCGSAAIDLMGFGPTVSDGFGIGYVITEDDIHCSLASRAGTRGDLERFHGELEDAFNGMAGLLE